MALIQFPKKTWQHRLDSNETILLARQKLEKSGELVAAQVYMQCIGTALGSESLRIGVHLNDNDNYVTSYALSEPRFVLNIGALITGAPTGNFFAAVQFVFNNIPINKNQFYHFTLISSGYTRVGTTHYLCAVKDVVNPINVGGLTSNNGSKRPGKASYFAEITE